MTTDRGELIVPILAWIGFVGASAIIAWLATGIVRPWLTRWATVEPNARSSHLIPTPQGAGIAVIVTTLVGYGLVAVTGLLPPALQTHLLAIAVAALALALVGLLDDVRGLPVLPRLAIQAFAVAIVIGTLPTSGNVISNQLPFGVERAILFVAGIWFINLYNFMDGVDLMSVTETLAITTGVALLAVFGVVPSWLGWLASALLGAIAGFSPWNAPKARLFLGDAGSLAIGLIVGTLLLHVAEHVLAAALILPLYYLTDSTMTMMRRIARAQRIWKPHRDHFYQIATTNGYSVAAIIRRVAVLDLILIVLAMAAGYFRGSLIMTLLTLAAALACTVLLLREFSRKQ